MRVQHNIAAMNSYRNYGNNTKTINKNLEKLSSGYKINRAGDDAAGLAISEKMRAQITGIAGAQKNAKDGISLVQTAEGALTEVHSMLNRMYDLAEQSANGTFEGLDREQLQKEVDQLRTEINRIADSSNFNGIKLLDGSLSSTGGAGGGSAVSADLSKVAVEVRASAQDVNSVKGKYTVSNLFTAGTGAASESAAAAAGDRFEITVQYKDETGKDRTVTKEIIVKQAASENGATAKYVLDDGTEDGLELKSVNKQDTKDIITDADFSKLAAEALRHDDAFANTFAINGTTANNLIFTAATGGTSGGVVTDVQVVYKSKDNYNKKATESYTYYTTKAAVTSKALDANKSYDFSKSKVWNNGGSNSSGSTTLEDKLEDAIFQINGKKFVFYNGDLNDEDKAKLMAAGVDHFEKTAGAAATESEIKEMVTHIQKETGLKVKQGTNTNGTWADAAAAATDGDVKLMFESLDSSVVKGKGLKLQIGDTGESFNQLNVSIKDIHVKSLGISTLDISDQGGAQTAMDELKEAINYVSDVRGTLGATQNRLEHTMNNLSVTQENLQDAESSIRDTDVADEMMKYTKNSILVQSAQAMLAQANQQPQGVLQLLQ